MFFTATMGHRDDLFQLVVSNRGNGYTYHNPCAVQVPPFQTSDTPSFAAYKPVSFPTSLDRPYPILATGQMGWSSDETTAKDTGGRIPPHVQGDGGTGPLTQYGPGAPSNGGFDRSSTKQKGLAKDGLVFIPVSYTHLTLPTTPYV